MTRVGEVFEILGRTSGIVIFTALELVLDLVHKSRHVGKCDVC